MMLKVLNWPLIMSPSEQYMSANVVLVVTFLSSSSVSLLNSRLKIVLLHFSMEYGILYLILGVSWCYEN